MNGSKFLEEFERDRVAIRFKTRDVPTETLEAEVERTRRQAATAAERALASRDGAEQQYGQGIVQAAHDFARRLDGRPSKEGQAQALAEFRERLRALS